MITIFVFILLVSRYSADVIPNTTSNIKTISIFSRHYEKEFEMKISSFESVPCEGVNTLKLERMNMNIIKDNLIQSDTIRHISFRDNSLTNISAIILKRVRNLICLDLSENKINLSNNNFIEHDKLRVLLLSDQNPEFTDGKLRIFITHGIYLPNLEYLFLSDNDIDLETISRDFYKSFPKLLHIYLDNINATYIPPDFFNKLPKALRALHLENNKLSNVTLLNITEITELYLDKNPLENVQIVSKKLKILSLSYCSRISHARIDLHTPYLEYLDLSHNNLPLQSNIRYDYLQFLKTLLLDYNELSNFPLFNFDLSITKLSLTYNKLTYIMSEYFKRIPSLKMLSLRGNRITKIENDAFKGLNNLEFLDLSQNKLIDLPNNWILPITNLKFFNGSSNNFEKISDMSINSFSLLTHLFVKNTGFTSITTKELETLPNSLTVYLN